MCECTRVFDEGKRLCEGSWRCEGPADEGNWRCEGPAYEGDKSRGQLRMSEGGRVDETIRLLTNKL
jgi:hypothetical protein